MPTAVRLYVPLGTLRADGGLFSNDGLVRAHNVIPVYGSYVPSPTWDIDGDAIPAFTDYGGLHVHFAGGSTYYVYVGNNTSLYEFSATFVRTDKTRAVGGPYTIGNVNGWQGASFGSAVIMTNYLDDPQLLTSPAAANFVKLAQSGGGNPGMDPKAHFVGAVRNNLALANLNLSAAFDTLPIGANPTVVAWSQSDNVRQYGSYNATPALTGTGYQPLNYDLGEINGFIGGDYGLVSLQKGFVRMDGPPYVFRPIIVGQGCRHPNTLRRFDADIYMWGPSGPSVLVGGEGPLVSLGNGAITRTVLDSATGFSPTYSRHTSTPAPQVNSGIDSSNGLVFWTYTTAANNVRRVGDIMLCYNINEERFSFTETSEKDGAVTFPSVMLMNTLPELGTSWLPGRDLVSVLRVGDIVPGAETYSLARFSYVSGAMAPRLDRSFQQLDKDLTTRVLRVRPVFRTSVASTYTVTVYLTSKNKPYESATTVSYTTQDNHGWIVTPTSILADFHQIGVGFTPIAGGDPTLVELEGYELEYVTGGAYSA